MILYLILTYIYYLIESLTGISIGGFSLRIRVLLSLQSQSKNLKMVPKLLDKLYRSAARSLFQTIPLFTLFDNLASKRGIKFTDHMLGFAVLVKLKRQFIYMNGDKSSTWLSERKVKKLSLLPAVDEDLLLSYLGHDSSQKREQLKRRARKRAKGKKGNSISSGDAGIDIVNWDRYIISHVTQVTSKESKRMIKSKSSMNADLLVTKNSWSFYLVASCLLYMTPLLFELIAGASVHLSTFTTPSPNSINRIYYTSQQSKQVQNLIFDQNFGLDYRFFILGGLSALFLPYLGVYSSIYISTQAITSSIDTGQWHFVVFGVLPQFVFESAGYIFGILAGIYITRLFFDFAQSYFNGENTVKLFNKLYHDIKSAVLFSFISIALILLASYVEAYITPLLLNHYYFIIK